MFTQVVSLIDGWWFDESMIFCFDGRDEKWTCWEWGIFGGSFPEITHRIKSDSLILLSGSSKEPKTIDYSLPKAPHDSPQRDDAKKISTFDKIH